MRPRHRGGILFKLLFLLTLVALLALLYLLRHPLLRAAGEFWVVDERPQVSDAILVLGNDNFFADRANRAAELYHRGWAPRVVASGRLMRPYASWAELMQRDLTQRGVPIGAVVRFPHEAAYTLAEARVLRGLTAERGWQRLLVVTSNYHTRRARYIFRRVFPPSVEVRVVAARDSYYDPGQWWWSREGVKLFFEEAIGFSVALWELRRAEAPPTGAPAPATAPARGQG